MVYPNRSYWSLRPATLAAVLFTVGACDTEPAGGVYVGEVDGVMLAVVAIAFLMFLAAGVIERALGRTGIVVITRLLGMLLAALSVQFVLDGIRGTGLI